MRVLFAALAVAATASVAFANPIGVALTGPVNYVYTAQMQASDFLNGYAPDIQTAGANAPKVHKNKTVKAVNDPTVKNFNCMFCKKQVKAAAQCRAVNPTFTTFDPTDPCAQVNLDLERYCHGVIAGTFPITSGTTLYALAVSTFAGCKEGPILAVAPVAASTTVKQVKYVTCKHCNYIYKQYASCVTGKFNNPGDTGIGEAMSTCLNALPALGQEICPPSAFWAYTVDTSTNKILAVTGEPTLLANFVCSPSAGAYIRSKSSDRPSSYQAHYAGLSNPSKLGFN